MKSSYTLQISLMLKGIKEEYGNPQDIKTKLMHEPYWRRRVYAFLNLAGLEYKAVCRRDYTKS